MLFPIACFTCNKSIGGRYKKYKSLRQKYRSEQNITTEILISSRTLPETVSKMADRGGTHRTPEAKALDQLHINRYCCRRHFLCDIDVMTI